MNFRAYKQRPACEVCRRNHRGPRCRPEESRSVSVTITLPGPVHRALVDRIEWGDRSRWFADLASRELDV